MQMSYGKKKEKNEDAGRHGWAATQKAGHLIIIIKTIQAANTFSLSNFFFLIFSWSSPSFYLRN